MNGLKLAAIASALLGCASAEQPADSNKSEMMHHDMTMPHVVSIVSKRDFAATLDSARMAVEKRRFKTFAVIDHAQGARSIGADLRPTTLIIFGNPNGGTPLMQAEQRLGLELPLKLLPSFKKVYVCQITIAMMDYIAMGQRPVTSVLVYANPANR